MKATVSLFLFVCLILQSCSSLRQLPILASDKSISATPINLLEGKFKVSADTVSKKLEANLYSYIFDKGHNPKSSSAFIEIKALDQNSLKISYYDSITLIKSRIFKGENKNGYFVFRRRLLFIPAIITNLYRDRVLRISLLPNNNLVADYNQISFGTFYIILPFFENKKEYHIEFQRLY